MDENQFEEAKGLFFAAVDAYREQKKADEELAARGGPMIKKAEADAVQVIHDYIMKVEARIRELQQKCDARAGREIRLHEAQARNPRLLVWIHSHHATGEPIEVDVGEVEGWVNLDWLKLVFKDPADPELVSKFFEHVKVMDKWVWLEVEAEVEEGDCDVRVVRVLGQVDEESD